PHAGGEAQAAGGLLGPLLRHCRRFDVLWAGSRRSVPPSSRLRRPDPQGREAKRPAGAGADQVRAGNQPQDRQDTWSRSAVHAAGPRRRGDRVKRREFITLLGGAAVARPVVARAQPVPVIGVLRPNRQHVVETFAEPFRRYMKAIGWEEGRNIRFL